MATTIIPEVETVHKSKEGELIYYCSLLCDALDGFEKKWLFDVELKKLLLYDRNLQSVVELKDRVIELLLSTTV